MKYHVHLYATVRVKTEPIEAESQVQAIEKAQEMLNMYEVFDERRFKLLPNVEDVEYGEEIKYFLVDEVGDDQYYNSHWYNEDKELENPK